MAVRSLRLAYFTISPRFVQLLGPLSMRGRISRRMASRDALAPSVMARAVIHSYCPIIRATPWLMRLSSLVSTVKATPPAITAPP